MAQNGDNWKEALTLSGLTLSDCFFSYPITRLGKEETKRAQENAKNIKRCSTKWCKNLRAPDSIDCAFHSESARNIKLESGTTVRKSVRRSKKIRQDTRSNTGKSVERVNLLKRKK